MKKKLDARHTCPLCGRPNYNSYEEYNQYGIPDYGTTEQYEAGKAAIIRAGKTPAEGHTDEAYSESIERGDINPWYVCSDCRENETTK